jgi:hypothetical protein
MDESPEQATKRPADRVSLIAAVKTYLGFLWLATARCNDGTLSLSKTAAGTCSGNGGVSVWYISGVCRDGSVTHAVNRQGACSGHGGIDQWLLPEGGS